MYKNVCEILVGQVEESDQSLRNQISIARTQVKQAKRSIFRTSYDSKKTACESYQSRITQLSKQCLKLKEKNEEKLQRICQQALILLKILKNKEQIIKKYDNWLHQLQTHKKLYNRILKAQKQVKQAEKNVKKLHQLIKNVNFIKQDIFNLLCYKKQTKQQIIRKNKITELNIEAIKIRIPAICQLFLPHLNILKQKFNRYVNQLFECYIIRQQASTIPKKNKKKIQKLIYDENKSIKKRFIHFTELDMSFNQDLKLALFMFINTISMINPKQFLNKHSYKNSQLHQKYNKDAFKQLFLQQQESEIEFKSDHKIANKKIIRVIYHSEVVKNKSLIQILVDLSRVLTKSKITVSESKVQFVFRQILLTFFLKQLKQQQYSYFTQEQQDQFQFLILS